MSASLMVVDLNACRRPQQEPYRLLAKKHGLRVCLVTPSAWREPFGLAQAEEGEATPNFELRTLRPLFNGRYHRLMLPGLEALLAECQPDHIWAHAEPENFLAAQVLRARERAWPKARLWLVSWRNIDYGRGSLPYRLAGLHQRIEDQSLEAGVELLCYNAKALSVMGRLGFATRPTRMGVNLSYFKPGPKAQARAAAGLPSEAKVLGFVGRCLPEKGVADLILAAAKIPRALVWVIGDGPALPAWRDLAKKNKVELRQRVASHEEMPRLMRAMDALVLPSRGTPAWMEQFGRVLVEGMACGIPVLGSSSGEIPNVINDAGWIFKEGDVSALGRGLKLALSPAGQAKARRLGPARARRYGWEAVAKDLAANFKFAAAGPRPQAATLGAGLWAGSLAQAGQQWLSALRRRQGGSIAYLNAHLANLSARQPRLRHALRGFDWVLPDGSGVTLAAKLWGKRLERMPLGDLVEPLARLALKAGRGVFLWGGEPGLAQAAASRLRQRMPKLKVLGAEHGFHDSRGEALTRAKLARVKPGLILIGMGSPKQEFLARELARLCPRALVVVCGNAFTFYIGRQRRAPKLAQSLGLEWLWRLAQDPGRLWRRYLLGNFEFLLRVAWARLGGRV